MNFLFLQSPQMSPEVSDNESDPDDPEPVPVEKNPNKGKVKKNVLRSEPSSPASGSASRPSSPHLPETDPPEQPPESNTMDEGGSQEGTLPSAPASRSPSAGDDGGTRRGKISKEDNMKRNLEMMRHLSRTGSGLTSDLADKSEEEVFNMEVNFSPSTIIYFFRILMLNAAGWKLKTCR